LRSCKDVSFLLSQSMDRRLPWHTMLSLRMHLMMCSFCRVARRQTVAMTEIVRHYGRDTAMDEKSDLPGLPPDTREQIKAHVREAAKEKQDA